MKPGARYELSAVHMCSGIHARLLDIHVPGRVGSVLLYYQPTGGGDAVKVEEQEQMQELE